MWIIVQRNTTTGQTMITWMREVSMSDVMATAARWQTNCNCGSDVVEIDVVEVPYLGENSWGNPVYII